MPTKKQHDDIVTSDFLMFSGNSQITDNPDSIIPEGNDGKKIGTIELNPETKELEMKLRD